MVLNMKKNKVKAMKSDRTILNIQRTLIYILCVVLVFLSIIPFVIMIVNATRSNIDIQGGLTLIPSKYFFSNYANLTQTFLDKGDIHIFHAFLNSLYVTSFSVSLSVYFGAFVAYGFTAYEFKGKKALFTFVIGVIMVPTQISLVGFYQFVLVLGLTDSYIPLIIPAIATPTTVFFLKQYLAGAYQKDLIDAARIDGCGEFGIFHKIMMPIMKPALATMAILSFVGVWNNYITPNMLIRDNTKYLLPQFIALFSQDFYRTDYGIVYMALTLSVVPLLIMYACLSQYIVRGIALGGVKE